MRLTFTECLINTPAFPSPVDLPGASITPEYDNSSFWVVQWIVLLDSALVARASNSLNDVDG